jgi:hypothetical protein
MGARGALARCRGIAGTAGSHIAGSYIAGSHIAGSHKKHFVNEGAQAREMSKVPVVAEPYVATGR